MADEQRPFVGTPEELLAFLGWFRAMDRARLRVLEVVMLKNAWGCTASPMLATLNEVLYEAREHMQRLPGESGEVFWSYVVAIRAPVYELEAAVHLKDCNLLEHEATGALLDALDNTMPYFKNLFSMLVAWIAKHEEAAQTNVEPPPTVVNPELATSKHELKQTWVARAMLLVRDHPDWKDAEIAERVGRNKSQLSRSIEYKIAANLARGSKEDRHQGYVTVDKRGQRDGLEAVAKAVAPADDQTDRGQPVPGSKYVREYCAECNEPMKVAPDKVGTKPVCDACKA